jgi:hypothetical protein
VLNIPEFTTQPSLYRLKPRYQPPSLFAGPAEAICPALLRRPVVCKGPGVSLLDEVAFEECRIQC